MATKPELNKAIAYEKIKATKWNENFNAILNYIEEVSEELTLKLNTVNSQLSSSILSNLQSVYPVGSLYIGVTDNCPIANLFGTWEKVAEGLCLQGATGSQVSGEIVEAGLPNITGRFYVGRSEGSSEGAFVKEAQSGYYSNSKDARDGGRYRFDASLSNSIYGKSNTVQPPAYLVNVWKRTA